MKFGARCVDKFLPQRCSLLVFVIGTSQRQMMRELLTVSFKFGEGLQSALGFMLNRSWIPRQ